jgi:two-component system phosphate regulon response regulator PhoB
LEPRVKVEIASNGEEGVSIARVLLPDLILVDWVLKETSGENVVRALRTDAATKSIPTILVSSILDPTDPRESQRARSVGANLFLTKDQVRKILLSYDQEPTSARRTRVGPILIIDNDPGIQFFVRRVLSAKTPNLVFATDGRKGLELARKIQPSAILLDLVLPVLNGVDVFKLLKADSTTKDIPILLMTGIPDTSGVVDSFVESLHATDCIRKPLGAEELAARVTRMLRSRPIHAAEQTSAVEDLIVRRGRIQINLTRNKVSAEGRPIELWPSLYSLLRVLISHSEAVSVARIIADGGVEDQSPEAIRKGIQRLREALSLSDDPIVAVGRGYKLVG